MRLGISFSPSPPSWRVAMCNKSQGFYGLNSTLSPAAQRVLDAATAPTGDFCLENVNEIAAAALRAAAVHCKQDRIQLLAVADELEGQ